MEWKCVCLKNERFYYGILQPEEKRVYKTIFEGLKAKLLNITVISNLQSDKIMEIYVKVLYDNPLFFYINQTVIKIKGGLGYWILLPEYLYKGNEIDALTKDIHKIVKSVAEKAYKNSQNEFQLEKYLHDSVVKSVAYDYGALREEHNCQAYSIVGAFLDNKAVCEGISKAFKLLCNEVGIKCLVVLGKADKEGNFEGAEYHAWNLVKIGKESYHVDVTWDNLCDKDIRHISYDYFNVTTKEILLDHCPTEKNLPICDAVRLNYFYSTDSFIRTYTELVNLIFDRFDLKEIMFKVIINADGFQTLDEIKEKTGRALAHVMLKRREKKKYILIYNRMHNIVKIVFM